MKAIYKNSFCMDSSCINYFEDMCMVALGDKGTEIEPYAFEERDSKQCKEFIAGSNLAYVDEIWEVE